VSDRHQHPDYTTAIDRAVDAIGGIDRNLLGDTDDAKQLILALTDQAQVDVATQDQIAVLLRTSPLRARVGWNRRGRV